MAQVVIRGGDPDGGQLNSALTEILGADDIQPGAEPSYQLCKTIYLAHPLGSKMVDAPIKLALSRPRDITVSRSPGEDCAKAFRDEWKRMRCDPLIKQHASVGRTYGLGVVALGCVGKPADVPLKDKDLYEGELFLNVLDPLNTSGSIAMDQDPNSPMFQKWTGVSAAGVAYHRSRVCVLMNEAPVYISWTSSAYSFSGRSVYQRALFPLKSFIQTMITDDMVSRKAGLLVAKINPTGSIIDNIMAAAAALKRRLLQQGQTNQVISINTGNGTIPNEEIESLNMMNIDKAGGWARSNILKNIATASDMPAWFLENETLAEGFGEGSEDADNILRYIDDIREWLQPIYDFLDPIVMQRAWNPAFFEIMKTNYPTVYGRMTYEQAFYQWRNSFDAAWPTLKKEDPSKAVERDKVKLEGVCSVVEILSPFCDPDNLGKLVAFACDAISENKEMFPSPLELDIDDIVENAATKQLMDQQAQQASMQGGEDDEAGGEPKAPKPMAINDSVQRRQHQASLVLEDLRDRRARA